jgi:signal transduction histidine kinase
MTRRARIAWVMAAVTWAAAATQVVVAVAADGIGLFSAATLYEGFPIVTLAAITGATVGALIVARQPGNRIGWLLCVGQLLTLVGLAVADYGRYAFDGRLPGSRETAQLAMYCGHLLGGALAISLVTLLLLLVPDGRLLSRRWRPAAAAVVIAPVVNAVAVLVTPVSAMTTASDPDVPARTVVLGTAAFGFLFVGVLAAAVALPLRMRRARGEQRQQLRWIALSAGMLVGGVVVNGFAGLTAAGSERHWYLMVPLFLGYLSVPVATGFAVLRYRLYDVDIILSRALLLLALLAFVTAGYVAVVVVIGAFLGRQAGAAFWPSLLATALVALGFQPLRRRVSRWADRVAYGERAAPYEALGSFTRELESSLSTAELLPRVAEAAARTVGASASVVTLAVPGGEDVRVVWPVAYDAAPPAAEGARRVTHAGGDLGTIAVAMPPGRSLRKADVRLLDDLAVQAAVPFVNARLHAALEQRSRQLADDAAAIEASRRRLVLAGDAERRRLARSLNREVLPYLDLRPVSLDDLPALTDSVGSALDALRRISKGVFPPVLARKGLVSALRAHLGSAGHSLEVDGTAEGRRFDGRVEAAAYFCCVEAVCDLSAPAAVRLVVRGDTLQLSVEGVRAVGRELEADLQLVSDRLAAVRGEVAVSSNDSDVRVVATIALTQDADEEDGTPEEPVLARAHSLSSRSGSNADLAT